jgi:hypothetical protein
VTCPLAARAMTRLAVGGRDGSDVAAADRAVLVNASADDADRVARALGRRPETVTWR